MIKRMKLHIRAVEVLVLIIQSKWQKYRYMVHLWGHPTGGVVNDEVERFQDTGDIENIKEHSFGTEGEVQHFVLNLTQSVIKIEFMMSLKTYLPI
jgi:hypothetical protein